MSIYLFFRGYDAAIKQIVSAPYTGYFLEPVVNHLPEYKDCKVEHTGFFTNKVNTGFAFQKNSSLKRLFNRGILKMIENGEMNRMFKKYGLVKRKEKKCGKTRKSQQLGFENILVVFIVLGFGILTSILLLVIECIIKA